MSDHILSVRHPRHGACWLRVVVCTFTESNYRILYINGTCFGHLFQQLGFVLAESRKILSPAEILIFLFSVYKQGVCCLETGMRRSS